MPPTTAPAVPQITLVPKDISYDHRAAQCAVPVELTYQDGTVAPAALVMTPAEMMRVSIQLDRQIDRRRRLLVEDRERAEAPPIAAPETPGQDDL
ncbi:hypothetical protein [Streptomyces orinoci]|uniref:Uncharacterized protein n=1 Tax=Streptomyces orinoci TaxID=67339 RepID=A0ABV3K147_STRON|nr:hypothetical protein [Streptomyces orinoci]